MAGISPPQSTSGVGNFNTPFTSNSEDPLISQQPQDLNSFKCNVCSKYVKTSQGLKIHFTKKHKDLVVDTQSLKTTLPVDNTTTRSHSIHLHPTPAAPLENILRSARSSMKIIRRIPKGARGFAASTLANSIDSCVDNGTPEEWVHFLLFTATCLQVPPHREGKLSSLTSQVKNNIQDYASGKELRHAPDTGSTRRSRTSPQLRSKLVQAKLADGDVRGAIRLLGTNDTFAPPTPESLAALKTHHPDPITAPRPQFASGDTQAPPLQVTVAEVKGAIASFPAGSAGGLDLLRPQHLKDLTCHSAGEAGARLLTSLTRLCNLMLAGEVPEIIRPTLYGAALCAFNKPSGGIRPIAIGCTYRRLVAKLCCNHLSSRLGHLLQPTQLGFGAKSGIELATHSARRFVLHQHTSPRVLLKIDFRNAFNTLYRHCILQSVLQQAPEIYQYVLQCYGSPSLLAFGDNFIQSSRGVQQGDPLGPPLFCLVLHPLIKDIKSDLNLWYLDDGTLGGDPNVALEDFTVLSTKVSEVGLEINNLKCELFCLHADPSEAEVIWRSFQKIAPNIPLQPLHTCSQLGTPLFPEAVASSIHEKTETLRLVVERMKDIPNHCAYYILKNSQAIPKLTFLLRCSPAWQCPEALYHFDNTLRDALSSILNVSLSEGSWLQSSWPTRMGGLGIRHSSDLALPAFLASVSGVQDRVADILPPMYSASTDDALISGIERWREIAQCALPSEDKRHSQKDWEKPLLEKSVRQVNEMATSLQDKARLIGVSDADAGAFLNALPSMHIGTLMDNDTFRIAVGLRLGTPLCQPHTCSCGTPVDSTGIHGLSCKRSAGRIPRHAAVNSLIHRALNSAAIPSSLEPTHLACATNLRPDGVTQIPWRNGKSLAWDYTCADSLSPSHVSDASCEALATASKAETNKNTKYAYLGSSHIFVPVASECLGAFGQSGKAFLREIGLKLQVTTGEKQATTYLFQRLSVEIQRGNARAIMGTLQGSSLPELDVSLL